MRTRLRQRLLQGLALLAVIGAGVVAWQGVVRPDPDVLSRLADEKLKAIFGPDVEYDTFEIDLVSGVTVDGLRVTAPGASKPAFVARRVGVRHDLIALASGLYRPESIHIEGARIDTRETEDGVALAFPFKLDSAGTEGALPRIVIAESTLTCQALDESERLRGGTVLVLEGVELDARPEAGGVLGLRGSFQTRGLGQDEVRIRVEGSARPDDDALLLGAVWDPFRITAELLDRLAPSAAQPIEGQLGEAGHLVVSLSRRPDHAMGEVQVGVRYRGNVRVDLASVPGVEVIDAQSLDQLQALLESAALDLEVTPGETTLEGLAEALGGAEIAVRGTVRDEGGTIDLTIHVKNLRLADERLQEVLGEQGRAVFDLFDPDGIVDADILITKRPGEKLHVKVDAILEDTSFRYLGRLADDGHMHGFPYQVESANGAIHIEDDLIWFDDIRGRHGADATVRIRSPWERAWRGGETGRIRLTGDAPDLSLTVEGRNIPVDEDLWDAVRGSEFYDLGDLFWFDGVIDVVEVDIILVPGRDTDAMTEVRLTLDDESFRYARFPLLLTQVKGEVAMVAPFLDDTTRASLFTFDVAGRVGDATVHLLGEYDDDQDTGLVVIDGRDVPLDGDLAETVYAAEATRDGLARVWRFLDPQGFADVHMEVPIGEDTRELTVKAVFKGASIRLDAEHAVPAVEIQDLTGELTVAGDVVKLIGLRGRLQDTTVWIDGEIVGGTDGTWDIRVRTDVLRATPDLMAGLEHLADDSSLLPEGFDLGRGARLALLLHIRRAAGEDAELEVDVEARNIDGTLRLPEGTSLTVRGDLLKVEDGDVTIEGVRGEGAGIVIEVARAHVTDDLVRGRMTLHLESFTLTEEVLDLLPEEARGVLSEWGQDRLLDCSDLVIESGEDDALRFEGDLTIRIPEHATTQGGPRGRVLVRPLLLSAPNADGVRAVRGRVEFQGFTLGDDIPVEDLDGRIDIETLVLGDEPSGRGTLRAQRVRVFDVRARDLVVPFAWSNGILRAAPVTGVLAEGRLQGRLLLHTREPAAYEGSVRVDDFSLAALREDLAPTGPPLSGTGRLEVDFQSRSGETRDLTARGRGAVRDGNLGDLPVAATIFAFLANALHVSDPPTFERALAEFTLEEEVITLQRFDLAGPLFDMPGRGRIDLGGFVDLTFTPDVIKSFALPGIMQFPVVGGIVDTLLREDWLYAIRLRGDVSTAEPEVVFIPPLGLEAERPFEGTGVPDLPPRRVPRWFR